MKTIECSQLLACLWSAAWLANAAPAQPDTTLVQDDPKFAEVDSRILNIGYWSEMIRRGLVPSNPQVAVKLGIYRGSQIAALGQDSLDVLIVDNPNLTQTENSVFVHPNDVQKALNSNNSTDWVGGQVSVVFGTSAYATIDQGATWSGFAQLPNGGNNGDPAAAIDLGGRYYIGGISATGGQEVNFSTDENQTWTKVLLPFDPGEFADKNHLWVDNSPGSPFVGNLYSAWTNLFGANNDTEIELAFSTNGGLAWTGPIVISAAVAAGSHNQGVNLQTGPNGDVYAVWAIYDAWPADENAMGFAMSNNGGANWQPATRIIENIRGIRETETSKNHRVNSFPVMATDISDGPNSGNIYVTWANVGVPGVNVGPDIDIYLIKSTDGGNNWSTPIRVNQDPIGSGNEHYFPWITCDPVTGGLLVVSYDDRNVPSTDVEVFVAYSLDGGDTWVDSRVSDTSFTPTPIPGLNTGYFGDYLGISARARQVYPVWTGNPTGQPLTYTSPFELVEAVVWVDFANAGPEDGTFDNPFDTLAEGLLLVADDGTVTIKAGVSNETLTIDQPVTLVAFNGQVVIGQQ